MSFPGDQRFSLNLTKFSCGPGGHARAERLKALLNGQTCMRFEVIAAPRRRRASRQHQRHRGVTGGVHRHGSVRVGR